MVVKSTQIASSDELVRSNAIHIFAYLKELAQLRTKVVRDCQDYEDLIWFNDIPKEQGCFTIAWGTKTEGHDDEWIEIRKMREPPCPKPPMICSDWVVTKDSCVVEMSVMKTMVESEAEAGALLEVLPIKIK
jgi:hypothetical protein